MREPKNQMLGTMEPPPLMQLSVKVNRGVRQGDPLSSILFVVAMEVLLINIREDNNIEGIQIDQNNCIKLSCYADDLTCFIKGTSVFSWDCSGLPRLLQL